MVSLKDYALLFIDFETFYDTENDYDLKSISMTEYIRDTRFQAQGMAYKMVNLGEGVQTAPHWLCGDHALRAFFGSVDWANTILVAHNVKFDGAILAWRYSVKPAYYLDTQTMAKAVLGNNVSSYSLRNLAAFFGLEPKGELKTDGLRVLTEQEVQELATYCKHDTELCAQIFGRLIKEFPESQIPVMDWTVRCFIEPKLALNVELLEKAVQNEKARREKAIEATGYTKAALSSNSQFAALVRANGITVPTKISTRTGKSIPALSLADEGFLALKGSCPTLYDGRVAAKSTINETRGEALLNVGKTGLFPFDIQFSGAVQTHRFSGSNGGGGNPQNFPRKGSIREAVCAPVGQELIVGDFAAIELRIISWLAKEPRLINSLIQNTDIYSEFASKIYNIPVNKKDNPVERQFGKCAILGLGYGMGAEKFRKTVQLQGLEISEEEAKRVVDLYRAFYFNVPKLWKSAESLLPLIATGRIGCIPFAPFIKVAKGALILPSGLKIRYPNLRGKQVIKFGKTQTEWVYDVFKKRYVSEEAKLYGGKMIENICQALAGEICKIAITRCEHAGVPVAGQVHDELLAVSDYHLAVDFMKAAMEAPVPFWPEIRLKAEVGYGSNWADAKAA
jgi:hypothetical protein